MRFYILPIFSLILLCGANSAIAQSITAADGGTVVTPVGNRSDITGNQVSSNNQFHNFTNFNVDAGKSANFIPNNVNIQNILSRVTGGTPSQIQGLIQSSGRVNLFLMNPSGILFGNGASLNVPGSFTATTANAIGFGNNNWFNAAGNNNYANLTGTPNQFGFNSVNPGAIVNQGSLSVPFGNSLNLIGGTVINTESLSALGGNVTIAAVEGGKAVQITPGNSLLSYVLPIGAINSAIGNPVSLPELLAGSPLDRANRIEVKNGVVTLVKSQTPLSDRSGLVSVGTVDTIKGLIPFNEDPETSDKTAGKIEVAGKTIVVTNPFLNAELVNLTAADRILFEDLGGNELKLGRGVRSLTMQTTGTNGIIEALNPKDTIVVPNGRLQIKTDFVKLGNLEANTSRLESAMDISAIQDVTVGNLNTVGSIQLDSKIGNIKAGNISSSNNGKGSITTLQALIGNIEVETIEAGIEGDQSGQGQLALDIFAGGTFRAIGTVKREIKDKLRNSDNDVLDFIAKKIDKDNESNNINAPITTIADVKASFKSFFGPFLTVSDIPVSVFVRNGNTRIRYAGGAEPTNKFLNVTLQGGNSRFEIGAKEVKGSGDPYVAFDVATGKTVPDKSYTTFLSEPFGLVKNSAYTPIVLAKGVSGTVGAIIYSINTDGTLNIGVQDRAFGVSPVTPIDPKPIDPTIQKPNTPNISTIDLENRTAQTLAACPDKKTMALSPPEATRWSSTDQRSSIEPKIIAKNPCAPDSADDEILKILK